MSLEDHRRRLMELFHTPTDALIYLRGGKIRYRYETDYEYPFRQESNMLYLTGVDEPDFEMVLDLKEAAYHLFAPWRPPRYAVWNGHITPPDELIDRYNPDELHVGTTAASWIETRSPRKVHCLSTEVATHLENQFQKETTPTMESTSLPHALAWCRAIKDTEELDFLREAARVNNLAHTEVLKALRPGLHEYECKAIFEYHQLRHGLIQDAYGGIHASGKNSAVLHYTRSDRQMAAGDLYLIDAGHEVNGYASDITRTWPVSGTYSAIQRTLYQIVLEAQKQTISMVRPGIRMEELHLKAARIITEGLLDAGLLRGSADDLVAAEIHTLFFPHGLGHLLGLDTHDVGGVKRGEKIPDHPALKTLRVRRELEEGMVLTIEPGLYMIPALLEPAFDDPAKEPWLVRDTIQPLLQMGGVRIEDNLIVTNDGSENLTTVVKEIDDIEAITRE